MPNQDSRLILPTDRSFATNFLSWSHKHLIFLLFIFSPGCFDSGLQVTCIVGSGVSHLPLDKTPYILWGSGQASLLANQAQLHHGHWTSFWYLWQFGQVPSPVGKWNQHLRKACQQKEAWSALKFPGRCCVDCGLQKTQWTNTSRWHGSPNHHWLWKLHTGLQATWILCLSTLPPDSGTLMSKLNEKCTFIWKEDFGPLSNSPVFFLFSPGKMRLTMFLFQKWCVALFLKMSERGDSWWTDSSFSSLLVKLSQGFAWQYSQACGHPCCLFTFSYPMSSFQSTFHLICFDTALLEQPPLSAITLCDLPSLWRV